MLSSPGLRNPFVISDGVCRFQPVITASNGFSRRRNTHLVVHYLTHSPESFEKEALSALPVTSKSKVTHLKSATSNSDLVVNLFKKHGLNDAQISDIISSSPRLLKADASKTLEPKIMAFLEFGFAGSDLFNLLKRHSDIFGYGLHSRIIPGLKFIKNLVGTNENVIKVITRTRWVKLTNNHMKTISSNVLVLQNFGLSKERIVNFFVTHPNGFAVKPEWFESRVLYIEKELGIPPSSGRFIHAVNVVLLISESEVEKRIQVFRSFGWSDSEISMLLRRQPHCLSNSVNNLRHKLNFYMKELGYEPSYLTRCSSFFTLSLEKRVKPRNKIFNVLREKGLLNEKWSFITFVTYSELDFHALLQSFESELPGLCESYMNSVESSKSKAEQVSSG